MSDGTVEIVTGRERQRRWSIEEKLRIVAEAEERGTRVTGVAARCVSWAIDQLASAGSGRLVGILDDFSRYIVAWKLCTTMTAGDVTRTLEKALVTAGCSQVCVRHKAGLLSDYGPGYIATGLAEWLEKQKIQHLRGAPCHPQT